MSSWATSYRRIQAEQRREERDAQKRRRELERRLKEAAKLSSLEQARLEVERYENAIDVLLSVHKEQSVPMDWPALAFTLAPHRPAKLPRNEIAAHFKAALAPMNSVLPQAVDEHPEPAGDSDISTARASDDRAHEAACAAHAAEYAEWSKERAVAERVLQGDGRAYTEALAELSPFTSIESLGSSLHVIVHNPKVISCELKVNPPEVVPGEVKALNSSGKLSVKTMPKSRAHEIYQDHVCACALRLCREMFAFLPVDVVIATAFVDGIDPSNGNAADVPILSVQLMRNELTQLDFLRLDPSDAVGALRHRGDVKASRRTGQFTPIEPLLPDESQSRPEDMDFVGLINRLRETRDDVRGFLKFYPASEPADGCESGEP